MSVVREQQGECAAKLRGCCYSSLIALFGKSCTSLNAFSETNPDCWAHLADDVIQAKKAESRPLRAAQLAQRTSRYDVHISKRQHRDVRIKCDFTESFPREREKSSERPSLP